jgi:hypothetical protein
LTIEKEPFVNYTLGEKDKNVFTVRVNDEEKKLIEELKEMLNIKSDSKALKMGAQIGLNVLHHTFGKEFLMYLFKKERSKLEDYKNF